VSDSSLLAAALGQRLSDLRERLLEPVEVAVLDSGIDGSHERLKGRIVRAHCCDSDDDGNVEIIDADPQANNDLFGHGTAVASILCELAPNARIVDIRVLGSNNRGRGEPFIAGFEKAVDDNSRIINLSVAVAGRYAGRLAAICEQAYFQNQIVVAARRNRAIHDEGFPATLSSTIGVANKRFDDPFVFEFADHVIEYAAHGDDVVVAAPGGGYTTMTGTSFATPTISAIAALLIGAFPQLKPFDVKALLKAYSRNQKV
jgi:subtilisin family serine protease